MNHLLGRGFSTSRAFPSSRDIFSNPLSQVSKSNKLNKFLHTNFATVSSLEASILGVEYKINEVNVKINEVEVEIKKLRDLKVLNDEDKQYKEYLMKEKEYLMKKEEELRKEKEDLRKEKEKEKEDLRKEKEYLMKEKEKEKEDLTNNIQGTNYLSHKISVYTPR